MISPLLAMTTGHLRLVADLLIGGGLAGYLLQARGVHARTRAEARRVRLLLDSTFEGIIGLDLDGSCTSCNRACLQHLGYESADQLLGKKLHEICHGVPTGGSPQPHTDCAGAYKCIRSGETSYMDDELFWRADGTSLPVEFWLYPMWEKKTAVGSVLTFRDITRRKRAQDALHQTEETFKMIAENAGDLIAVVDPAGNRIYNNSSYLRVLGYTPEELKQTVAFEQIHPDDREIVIKGAAEAVRTGQGQVLEYRMRHRNGGYVALESRGGFIRNSAGEIESLVIVARDIRHRKHAEQAQKLEAIGQLASGIAHEINTPNQFIGDNISFLADSWRELNQVLALSCCIAKQSKTVGGPTPDCLEQLRTRIDEADLPFLTSEIPKALAQSEDGVQRIGKIVGAMRRFAPSGAEKKIPIDINAALETTMTVTSNEWKSAELVTDFESNLPPVVCLPDDMNQVFLHLIINAAHAIQDTGRDGESVKGTLTVRTRRGPDYVEVQVQDNGTGIPQEISHHIFEPFFTTKAVNRGSGQGLPLAHDVVVNKHGGQIWFETEVGKGTTFFVRIPLQASA
ncbi:MAG TPA: PAS domain S-box protein [Terriglobales bacterium]|nr:PAS domain S-box protein [Terriglobales bacterium]